MNKIYILLSITIMMLFSACAVVMTPEEIDSLAIKPNKMDKLFSPPKKGYARLIMYRESSMVGAISSYSVGINYSPLIDRNGYLVNRVMDRALCKIKNDSSCIVNIKAGKRVALLNWGQENDNIVLFTPKDRHIYCISISMAPSWVGQFNYEFKNANDCLEEYKDMYKPKHREYQRKWFDKLVQKGDKRAYRE